MWVILSCGLADFWPVPAALNCCVVMYLQSDGLFLLHAAADGEKLRKSTRPEFLNDALAPSWDVLQRITKNL
jgi:hypothetical protein